MPGGLFVGCGNFRAALAHIRFVEPFTIAARMKSQARLGSVFRSGAERRAAMFCDACGAALQGDQEFCGQCGRQVKQGVQLAYPRANRVQEHVRLLGIFWIALSALNTLQAGSLLRRREHHLSAAAGSRRPSPLLAPPVGFCGGSIAGQSHRGICRRLGFAATGTVGARRGHVPGVPGHVLRRTIRRCSRHLYALGAASREVGRGI